MSTFVAVVTELSVTATQATPEASFVVSVSRNRDEWRENGSHRSTTDVVGEEVFDAPLPAVFLAVNDWLLDRYRAAVLPRSWTVDRDATNALILRGDAVPAVRPMNGPPPQPEQVEPMNPPRPDAVANSAA